MKHCTESYGMETDMEQKKDLPYARFYIESAIANQIDIHSRSFREASDIYHQEQIKSHELMLVFLNRLNSMMRQWSDQKTPPYAVTAFNKDGCILRTFDPTGILSSRNCREKTLWSLETTGPNAVTVGLQETHRCTTVGNENYLEVLQDLAIYFAPFLFQNQTPGFPVINLGGVAIITNAADAGAVYEQLLTLIIHDMSINLHCSYIVTALHARGSYGMLFIDLSNHDKPYIVDFSDQFFQISGLPTPSYRHIPLEELIDRSSENRRFWDIVRNQEWVSGEEVTVKIANKHVAYIITSDPYQQRGVGGNGIIIRFETSEKISAEVSKKITNTAILTFDRIVGSSDAFCQAVTAAKIFADTDSNVLLLGESGVGKDVFAQAIHNRSQRRDQPFVVVNCGALPRERIESELFGYAPGSFTGAKKNGNIGKFELANNGTIFLDEIGELPLDLQATLLRVVEQKQFMRLGDNRMIKVNVKIICATNADLRTMIRTKQFRSDLYYRLSTMQLVIPPLRDRGSDIIALAEFFISTKASGRSLRLTEEATNYLMRLPFPGNERELQSLIERTVLLTQKEEITSDDLRRNLSGIYSGVANYEIREEDSSQQEMKPLQNSAPAANSKSQIKKRKRLTKEDIIDALEKCEYNREDTARLLGISRATLYRQMNQFQ